jgi:WD40 repeat protein
VRTMRATLPMLLPLALIVPAPGCESPTREMTDDFAIINVTVRSSGASFDADGYLLRVDRGEVYTAAPDGLTKLMLRRKADAYDIELIGLAPNCRVTARGSRMVTVLPGKEAFEEFEVECSRVIRDIAFTTNRDGRAEIYALGADGSYTVRLTISNGASGPAWSPDGRSLAFECTDGQGSGHICVMDPGASSARVLGDGDGDAAWSHDGASIAYTARGGWFGLDVIVWIVNPDGSNPREVADGANPAWSPDDTQLAIENVNTFGFEDIYIVDVDGSDPVRLTTDPRRDYGAAWSPDGKRIAFTSLRDGNHEIYVMDADGSNQTRLTENDAMDFGPAWSPDGTRIAFTTDRDGNMEVYAMNADGSHPVNLSNHPASDWAAAWGSISGTPPGERDPT